MDGLTLFERPYGPGFELLIYLRREDPNQPDWATQEAFRFEFAIFGFAEGKYPALRELGYATLPRPKALFKTCFLDTSFDEYHGDYDVPGRAGEFNFSCTTQHLTEQEVVSFAQELCSIIKPYAGTRADSCTLVTGGVAELFKAALAFFVRLRDLTEERNGDGLVVAPPVIPLKLKDNAFLKVESFTKIYHNRPHNAIFFIKLSEFDQNLVQLLEFRLHCLGYSLPTKEEGILYCNKLSYDSFEKKGYFSLVGVTLEEFNSFADQITTGASFERRFDILVDLLVLARSRMGVPLLFAVKHSYS